MSLKYAMKAMVVCLALCIGQANAEGTLIPAADRKDMVHDAKRGIIYITDQDKVLRYEVQTQTFLPPIILGGQLSGADLSPDGNTLAVADRSFSGGANWVHLVNLDSLATSKLTAPLGFYEGGTWTVTYAADGSLLATSMFQGSGGVPLRQFDPVSGTATVLATVQQNTMLSASGDAQTIAFAESNISDGRWGLFDVPTKEVVRRQWYDNGTGWSNFEIATDRLASQFAIPTYGGTFIYNDTYQKIATLGQYAGPQPIAAAYHPVEKIAYFPWAGTQEVKVFDMNTFTQTGSLDFENSFTHTGNGAFNQGRIKLSRDGSLVMASVAGGVRYVQVYAPLKAEGISTGSVDGAPVTTTLQGSIGNGGALEYSIVEAPQHGTVMLIGAEATYVPEAGFEGVDQYTYRVSYGRATADAVVSVTSTVQHNQPPVAADDAVVIRRRQPVLLSVLANDSDPDGDSISLVSVTQPSHGAVSIFGNSVLYVPPRNHFGSTKFTYTISDGQGGTAIATVTVTVQ